jgi:hypothetical protein
MNKTMSRLLYVNFNPGKGTLGSPYDSTYGIPFKVQLIIIGLFILFALYVGYKVWNSLNDENSNHKIFRKHPKTKRKI